MSRGQSRSFLALVGIGVAVMFTVAPAQAHIQVLPSEVAPADPVLFTVLVPGETASGTSKVELKVPPDVYPFSFEETPGWKRKLIKKPNGLIDQIEWTGRAAPDGLVRFTFLAGTPEKETSIKWPAIQTYASGEEARWIGSPESEHPAPVTVVSDSAASQNAGGEGGSSEGESGADANDSDEKADAGSDPGWALTAAALLGLFFGLSSFVVLLINRKKLR